VIWRCKLAHKNHSEHARVTAICVNLALDAVEADLRQELDAVSADGAAVIERVLARLRARRVPGQGTELKAAGTC
jgi:hypothetical protein